MITTLINIIQKKKKKGNITLKENSNFNLSLVPIGVIFILTTFNKKMLYWNHLIGKILYINIPIFFILIFF